MSDTTAQPVEVDFFDPDTNRCPYPAYERLRDLAPVWRDPATGMFVLTRYEDVRAVLLDTDRFTNTIGNGAGATAKAMQHEDPEEARKQAETARQAARLEQLYQEKGWVPAPALDSLDEPRHMETRRIFDHAFRPERIAELEPYIAELAERLIQAAVADGRCEWVGALASPLPLYVIGRQMGVPEGDMHRIKRWTDAWVQRLGLMLSEEQQLWSVEQEIEAQHYFQPIFERLRREPDDSLLSVLVNREVPEWGRPMNDNELHGEVMGDMFVAGAETTTNALSAGMVLLIENPQVWAALKRDPDRHLPTFIEEVVRLESPVQGLLRQARVDVVLHGQTIPAGAVVNLRYGAANRDERRFECPTELDLERPRPKSHLGFGTGLHHCLGAVLARSELTHGFRALLDHVDEVRYVEGADDFRRNARYQQNFFLRAISELHVELVPAT